MKRELDLPADVWHAFDRAADARGSHEAVVRHWLGGGGVFEAVDTMYRPSELELLQGRERIIVWPQEKRGRG